MNRVAHLFLVLFLFSSCLQKEKLTRAKEIETKVEELCRISSDSSDRAEEYSHGVIFSHELWHHQFQFRMPPFEVLSISELKRRGLLLPLLPYPESDTLKSMPPALRSVYRLTNPKIIDVNGDTIKRSRVARDSVSEKEPFRD